MRTKLLITGSSGTLGRVLVKAFATRGIPVVGLDIKQDNPVINSGSIKYYNCSITDRDSMAAIFKKEKPTHVLHLACSYNTIRDRDLEYENDVLGSENVVNVTNETPSVKQFVYFSSGAAYGGVKKNKPWLSEDTPLRPGKYRYGLNKKYIEEKLLKAKLRRGLKTVILRICTVVGPGYDKDRSVVSILIKFPYMLKMCKNNMVQFLHEDDFVEIMNHVINDGEAEGVFNLASDTAVIVKNLVPGKKYVHIPFWLLKSIFTILWNLKLLNLQPACLSYSVYPVVIDPSRIVKRYNYRFRYSSKKAFEETKKKNMLNPNEKL